MYFDPDYMVTVSIIVALLFIIPIALKASNNKLFKNFTFKQFIRVLNQALIYQIITGVITLLIALVFCYNYSDKNNILINTLTNTIVDSMYCYIIVGCFCYLPIVGLINLINLIITYINKRRIH